MTICVDCDNTAAHLKLNLESLNTALHFGACLHCLCLCVREVL